MKFTLNRIKHIFCITIMVYILMGAGALVPISLGFLNPFKAGVGDYESTDLIFSRFKSGHVFDDRIVVVNSGKPDRSAIAKALTKLKEYKVKAIGVDIVFEEVKDEKTDSLLQAAVLSSSNIVLADELHFPSSKEIPAKCNTKFCNAENVGYINFVAKPDHTVRYFSPREMVGGQGVDAFSGAVVRKASPDRYRALTQRSNKVEQINYRGNLDNYVHVDIQALLGSEDLSSTFQDKIVLMGYVGEKGVEASSKDMHYSPMNEKFALKTLPDMYGMVIHANIISMILDQDYINSASGWICGILSFGVILLMVAIMRSIFLNINPGYWKVTRFIQLLMIFVLFTLSTVSFYFFNYKLGLTTALVGVALSWDCVKIYENIVLKKQSVFKKK